MEFKCGDRIIIMGIVGWSVWYPIEKLLIGLTGTITRVATFDTHYYHIEFDKECLDYLKDCKRHVDVRAFLNEHNRYNRVGMVQPQLELEPNIVINRTKLNSLVRRYNV